MQRRADAPMRRRRRLKTGGAQVQRRRREFSKHRRNGERHKWAPPPAQVPKFNGAPTFADENLYKGGCTRTTF